MNTLSIIAVAILLALLGGRVLHWCKLPSVTGWVIMGVILGGSFLGIFKGEALRKVDLISDLALGVIAFSIGSELLIPILKRLGRSIVTIVVLEALGAFVLVTTATFLMTHKFYIALILGAISSATAPAATVMVLKEVRAKGDLTTTILSVVAIDDGIALILYAFASSVAKSFLSPGNTLNFYSVLGRPGMEILGSLLLGFILGFLISFLSRWIPSHGEFFALIVGGILIGLGLSKTLHLSELLTNMALGVTLANLAPRKLKTTSAAWEIVTPFLYMAFFSLAGAHLNIRLLPAIWLLGLIYTGARMLGKVSGASLGAKLSRTSKEVQKYIGFSLFPQIGVALALAIMVGRDFLNYGEEGKYLAVMVINILLFTTIITETVGPFLTKWSVVKAGEAGKAKR